MEEFLQVGVITSTHGVRGEVKVFPTTDDAQRFRELKQVILENGKERLLLNIQGVKFFKQFAILKFKGIDTINDVEKYKGKALFIKREDAVKLKDDEYFIADLIDMKVFTEEEELGILKDVLETGANEVYVVDSKKYGEILIPAIHDCILNVDVANKMMKVHLLDGLV